MLDLLAATVTFTALVAAGLAVLAAVTLVPFVVTLQLADARRFAPARWGALSLAGSVLGLAVALLIARSDLPTALVPVGLLPALAGPALLSLLSGGQAVGGRAGRHQ